MIKSEEASFMPDPEEFQRRLLDWYDREARILPWRGELDPYKIWISEMMLQQTRVDTVIPYYFRFIAAIPSVDALSLLPEDQLLKLWQGLGYYRRAMNLQKAARIIMERFHGQLPSAIADLQSLPGIGPYSSGAIASIAFGTKTCAIDGNVLRVMARLTGTRDNIAEPAVKRRLEDTLKELLPEDRIGDFNQAMMELGALVCLPNGTPKCEECPHHAQCEAARQGLCAVIPEKIKDKQRRIETKTVFVISAENYIALRKRKKGGLLANLWEFPQVDGHLSEDECKDMLKKWGILNAEIIQTEFSRHIFSHLEWHMTGYSVFAEKTADYPPEWVWASKNEIVQYYAIPTAFKGFMKWIPLDTFHVVR